MPQLEWISAAGFKSIRKVNEGELQIAPINVIVGPNGSGKSNFLGLFTFLRSLQQGRLNYFVQKAGGANRILHFGQTQTSAIDLALCLHNGEVHNQYKIRLEVTEQDQLLPVSESVSIWSKDEHPEPKWMSLTPDGTEAGLSAKSQDIEYPQVHQHIRDFLGKCQTYHFNHTGANAPVMRNTEVRLSYPLLPNAENLASFLYSLRLHHEHRYELIRRTTRLVAPYFDDFVLEPTVENTDFIRLEWRHLRHEGTFDVSAMSDGTIRFVALATLFLQPTDYLPPVILIDEPELGLHPAAMTILAALIRSASKHSQIIVATQSPSFLDHFRPQDVLVASRRSGGTEFRRLDPAEVADELEEFRLGELWESNAFGGRPRSERHGS